MFFSERTGRKHRKKSGNILLVVLATISMLIVPLLIFISQFGVYFTERLRVQNIIEAAGLVVANDVSRIVINDSNFGYVSLSNHPPTGIATCAPDGEPLPVIGINTLVGTIRQNSIIARELGNQEMSALCDSDVAALSATIRELNYALADSLSSAYKQRWFDIHGTEIDPVADVKEFLEKNLPKDIAVESVRLTNGWLDGAGSTNINIPKPERLALLNPGDHDGGKYKPFIAVPVGATHFSFAAIGAVSTFVNSNHFQPADDKHICSVIKLECTLVRKDAPQQSSWLSNSGRSEYFVCTQPFSLPDTATSGVMTVRFSGSPVSGMQSWSDFLKKGNFLDNQVSAYDVVGGDFPVDIDARMRRIESSDPLSTSQQFAEHFYCWLRNGHLRPSIESVLAMLDEPFCGGVNQIYAYEFAGDGKIRRQVLSQESFPIPVLSDAQHSTVAATSISNGMTPVIVFRNNVRRLGIGTGGKHGGQPLAGYPLKSNEAAQYGGQYQLIDRFGRRRNFSRGLALDIEIGGLRESTASRDVESMRKIARRI